MEQDVPAVRARRSGRSRVVGAPWRLPRISHSTLKAVSNIHPTIEPCRGRHGANSRASTGYRPVDRRVRLPTLRPGPRDSVFASERGIGGAFALFSAVLGLALILDAANEFRK